MKYLKYPLFLILGLIIIYLILCAAGPKDMNVSMSTEIIAPSSIVFNLANSLREAEKWNEWSLNDTTIVTAFNDVREGVGASSSWTSKKSGDGTQKIIETIPHKKVRTEMTFKGWSGVSYSDLDMSETGPATNVTWTFEGTPIPFLIRGMALLTGMKKMMRTNYENGLANLKQLAEDRASGIYNGYEIKEEFVDEKYFVMNRQEVQKPNIQQFYATNLGALFNKVQKAGTQMKGMPCGLFFKWSEDRSSTDMAAAIPVEADVSIEGTTSFYIPSQKAIILDFYGDYNTIERGQKAIAMFMRDRGYLQDPPIVEEYVTDPSTEEDPDKWLTRITYYYSQGKQ